MFIDAKVVKGTGRTFSCSIQQKDETNTSFVPMDLSDYAIRFRVMGSSTADGAVLVEHIITLFSDPEVDGEIYNPTHGEFSFTITAEDTNKLGIGKRPIMIDILDADTLTYVDTLTQGGKNGEFNVINIIQV